MHPNHLPSRQRFITMILIGKRTVFGTGRGLRPRNRSVTVKENPAGPQTKLTRISIYVVRPANCHMHVGNPAIMTAYGGFGACMTPRFSVLVSVLLKLDLAFAMPLIRGGGEWGQAWHDAGKRHLPRRVSMTFSARRSGSSREGSRHPAG